MKELPKGCHLNGHTTGFCPQTSKVRTELHNSIISLEVPVTLNNCCNFIMTKHCI